ncbi:MAG: hypothetical protein R3C11_03605 [Planctomycetaceae bacterium]
MLTHSEPNISLEKDLLAKSDRLFKSDLHKLHCRMDRLFAVIIGLQWLATILAAFLISPYTWNGDESQTHLHLKAAFLLGGFIAFLPIKLTIEHPGSALTRQMIAISQMLTSALLIHISGGRIETHFHIFVSLAFLACYRDWRVLITATLVVAADHYVRGIYYPASVFGVLTSSPWRVFEHTGWVIFEDIVLLVTIRYSITEMRQIAWQRTRVEHINQSIEEQVELRTSELQTANEEILAKNNALETTALAVRRQAEAAGELQKKAGRTEHIRQSTRSVAQRILCIRSREPPVYSCKLWSP